MAAENSMGEGKNGESEREKISETKYGDKEMRQQEESPDNHYVKKEERRHRLRLFTFLPYEAPVMEAYLERMAEKGWMLEKLGSFYMKFVEKEPGKYRFCVDVYPDIQGVDRPKTHRIEAYRQCCEDSGWTFADGYRETQIFYYHVPDASEKGGNLNMSRGSTEAPEAYPYGRNGGADGKSSEDTILPIQTDEKVRRQLVKRYLTRNLILMVLLTLLNAYSVLNVGVDYRFFLNNSTLLLYTGCLFGLLYFLISTIGIVIRLIKTAVGSEQKRFTGSLRLKLAVKGINLAALGVYALVMLSALFGYFMKSGTSVISLLPVLLGVLVGVGIRYAANRSESPRFTRGCLLAVGLPAIFILLIVIQSIYWNLQPDPDPVKKVTGYPVITAADLGEITILGETQDSSILAELYYHYREYSKVFNRSVTEYIRAVDERTAKFIFDNMLAQSGKKTSGMFRGLVNSVRLISGSLYDEVIQNCVPLDAGIWNCDEGWMLWSRTIYLRKGNSILKMSVWDGEELFQEQALELSREWFGNSSGRSAHLLSRPYENVPVAGNRPIA